MVGGDVYSVARPAAQEQEVKIVILYAGLLACLYLVLTFRTIFLRGSRHVSLGDGGDAALQRAIRAHANFAEYVPLGLVLILLVEGLGASALVVHSLGCALLVGRILHAFGVSQIREPMVFRMIGMVLTTGSLGVSGLYLVAHYFGVVA
jgi:uncharacterized membrane protein YecN with MAPEG domain